MEIKLLKSEELTNEEREAVNRIAAAGFGQDEAGMYEDTMNHIDDSELIHTLSNHEGMQAFALYRRCLGGQAIEAAGVVTMPKHQGRYTGTNFIVSMVLELQPSYVTAYTRNPAMYKALRNGLADTGHIFPAGNDPSLKEVALSMDNAVEVDGTVYHLGRYGEEGLYGGFDPAERSLDAGGPAFKERFAQLHDISNALVVVGRTPFGGRQ